MRQERSLYSSRFGFEDAKQDLNYVASGTIIAFHTAQARLHVSVFHRSFGSAPTLTANEDTQLAHLWTLDSFGIFVSKFGRTSRRVRLLDLDAAHNRAAHKVRPARPAHTF